MTAVEILKKHKMESNHTPGVDPAGAGAQARAVANDKAAVARTTEYIATTTPRPGSRAALMQEAKAKGIKYFRILSKENLQKVLNPDLSVEVINDVIAKAREKWQAGWGKKKEVKNAV